MREIIINWIEEALKMKVGESLHFMAPTKQERNQIFKMMEKELKIFKEIDPERAVLISPFKTFKDGRFWIGFRRVAAFPTIGFIQSPDGNRRKVTIQGDNSEEQRIKKLMELEEKGE